MLFLSPILKCKTEKIQKPHVSILIDNSKSILNYKSISAEVIKNRIKEIEHRLNKKGYSTSIDKLDHLYSHHDSLKFTVTRTNLFELIQGTLIQNSLEGLNQIIILTDGNFNDGNSPLYVSNNQLTKIHTLLIGDTSMITDVKINHVEHNPTILQDEVNKLYVSVSGNVSAGDIYTVTLVDLQNNLKIESKEIKVNTNHFSKNISFNLEKLTKGRHHLRVWINSSKSEINTINNQYDFEVEVLDAKKNVFIYYSFPHPDISALISALKSNKSNLLHINDNSKSLVKADVIILYQIPNKLDIGRKLIEDSRVNSIPILFITGLQSDIPKFNELQTNFKLNLRNSQTIDLLPRLNPNFSNFVFSHLSIDKLQKLPPLQSQDFGTTFRREFTSLLHVRENQNYPLIGFSNDGNSRMGIIIGENIWRWRVNLFQSDANNLAFDELINSVVNSLEMVKNRDRLVTNVSKIMSREDDLPSISAYVYNDLYQSTQVDQIKCKVISQNGNQSTQDFIFNGISYNTPIKGLQAGQYKYEVTALQDNRELSSSGFFTIIRDSIENQYLPANFNEMNQLSNKFGGKLYLFDQYKRLISDLESQEFASKIISVNKDKLAIDSILILGLILFLICSEWLLRKYFGLH